MYFQAFFHPSILNRGRTLKKLWYIYVPNSNNNVRSSLITLRLGLGLVQFVWSSSHQTKPNYYLFVASLIKHLFKKYSWYVCYIPTKMMTYDHCKGLGRYKSCRLLKRVKLMFGGYKKYAKIWINRFLIYVYVSSSQLVRFQSPLPWYVSMNVYCVQCWIFCS